MEHEFEFHDYVVPLDIAPAAYKMPLCERILAT